MFGSTRGLPRVRAQRHQVGGEDVVAAHEPLDAHRGRDVGRRHQGAEVVDREAEHSEHSVGAVDEGQTLLLGQGHRLDAGGGEGGRGLRQVTTAVPHPALTHEDERAVRERRQVAGAAERAELVDDGGDARVEDADVGAQGLLANAGPPGREGLDPQEHEGPDDLALDLGTGAGRVRADERALELGPQLGRDVPRRERSEAGRDAVVRDRVVGERLDDRAARADALPPGLGHLDVRVVSGDGDDVVDGQGRAADGDRVGLRAVGRAGRHGSIAPGGPGRDRTTATQCVSDPRSECSGGNTLRSTAVARP